MWWARDEVCVGGDVSSHGTREFLNPLTWAKYNSGLPGRRCLTWAVSSEAQCKYARARTHSQQKKKLGLLKEVEIAFAIIMTVEPDMLSCLVSSDEKTCRLVRQPNGNSPLPL
jgi:hypothetical protein